MSHGRILRQQCCQCSQRKRLLSSRTNAGAPQSLPFGPTLHPPSLGEKRAHLHPSHSPSQLHLQHPHLFTNLFCAFAEQDPPLPATLRATMLDPLSCLGRLGMPVRKIAGVHLLLPFFALSTQSYGVLKGSVPSSHNLFSYPSTPSQPCRSYFSGLHLVVFKQPQSSDVVTVDALLLYRILLTFHIRDFLHVQRPQDDYLDHTWSARVVESDVGLQKRACR